MLASSLIINILSTSYSSKEHLISYIQQYDSDPKLNFFTVICQQLSFILVACLCIIWEVNFLDILDLMSTGLAPLISIYFPIYFYIKITGKTYLYLVLVILLFFNIAAFKYL